MLLKVLILKNLNLLVHALQVVPMTSQAFMVFVNLLVDVLVLLDSGSMHLYHPGLQFVNLGLNTPKPKKLSLQSITLKWKVLVQTTTNGQATSIPCHVHGPTTSIGENW